jgi:two-component system, NarL family, invasion response regulator UvrY
MATRILVADDHEIFRAGLKRIVATSVDMTVVDEAASSQELISKVQQNDYDMVILDISMPGRNGLDALAELKLIKPKLRGLVLSSHPEEQYALRAYKSALPATCPREPHPGNCSQRCTRFRWGKNMSVPRWQNRW